MLLNITIQRFHTWLDVFWFSSCMPKPKLNWRFIIQNVPYPNAFWANNCLSNSIWEQYCLYTTKRDNAISSWTTFDHCLIPKQFFDFVTILPNITEEEDFINNSTPSKTEVTSQHIPNPLTSDIGSLPMDIKRILRSCDFESMPLFRSHEEYFAALEVLENLWKKHELSRIEAKLTTIQIKMIIPHLLCPMITEKLWYLPF